MEQCQERASLTEHDFGNPFPIQEAHDAPDPLVNVETARCEAFKRSVGFFGSVEWNNIPPVIRHTDSYLAFKSLPKEAMLNPLSLIGDVQ